MEPLVSISEEKRKKDPLLPVVFLNQSGDCKLSENIEVSKPIELVREGKVPCIFASAEALLSPIGQSLMRDLRKKSVLACVDEAHLFSTDQWGSDDFRVSMSRAPSILAAQIRDNKGKI